MVHKKAKSKRGTARQNFKIIRNVAETHRKRRKEAKKNPKRTAKKKDPGIPNDYPFKEELLHTAQLLKDQKEQEKLELKQKKKEANSLLDSNVDLETFMDNLKNHEKKGGKSSVTPTATRPKKHQPGQMVLEQADMILHVLDARDPLFHRALSIENDAAKNKKKIIFMLNKIDLIPKDAAEKWAAHLAGQKLAIIPINSLNPSQESLALLKTYWPKSSEVKVGVVGFPLSGKTSLIRALQSAKLDNEQEEESIFTSSLLPVPGILFSQTTNPLHSSRVLFRNFNNGANVTTPSLTADAIISRFSKQDLSKALQVPFFIDAADLLVQYARKNNFIRRGGVPDTESSARGIIQEFYNSSVSYYTLPPKEGAASLPKKLSKTLAGVLGKIGETSSTSDRSVVFKTAFWETEDIIEELEEMPKGFVFASQDGHQEEEEEEEFEDEDISGDDFDLEMGGSEEEEAEEDGDEEEESDA